MAPTILDRVRGGHHHLLDQVGELETAELRQSSRLPGWSRAHVVAHLAHNARMLTRVTRHALRGELVEPYPDGDRDSAIERDSALDATALVELLTSAQSELEITWDSLAERDWQRSVRFRNGTVHDLLLCRWRENEIHTVDLALGRTEEFWSPEFCEHALDFLAPRLEGSDVLLVPGDLSRTWTFGDGSTGTVRGPVHTIACWMAGRTPQEKPACDGTFPDLGPWP
ncbi:maleylpyruvate isomerase family mycothiol-dependent enzyme [Halopolyspora algeriensis]|nr:maleylpyruvate isomerase family mycothiol-dependent enzyme [Halopolyspora algeriensis]